VQAAGGAGAQTPARTAVDLRPAGKRPWIGCVMTIANNSAPGKGRCARSSIEDLHSYRTTRTNAAPMAMARIFGAARHPRRCPKQTVILLHNRAAPLVAAALEVGCRCLSCPACGPLRQALWLAHLAAIFLAHDGQLYSWTGPTCAWHAVSTRLRRAGADFARVNTRSGLFVVATAAVPGAVPVTPREAVEDLAAALERLAVTAGRKGKPVSGSKNWQLHEGRSARSAPAWTRAGVVAGAQLEGVTSRAAAAGLRVQPLDVSAGRFARLAFPNDFSEQEVGEMLARWRLEMVAEPTAARRASAAG